MLKYLGDEPDAASVDDGLLPAAAKPKKGRRWGSADKDRFRKMVDDMPVNVMTCDLVDFRIDYANKATLEAIRSLEDLIGIKAECLLGTSIDAFHNNPEHQHQLMRDPSNLPHTARITLGSEVLDLTITALHDAAGQVLGAARELAQQAGNLEKESDTFLDHVRSL